MADFAKIPKFAGNLESFSEWKLSFDMIMTTMGLHGAFKEAFDLEDGNDADKKAKAEINEKAYAFLILALNRADAHRVSKEKPNNAKEAYKYLISLYTSSNIIQSLHILRDILGAKLT